MTRSEKVGRWLSIVGHPFVLLPLSVSIAQLRSRNATNVMLPVLATLALIALYVVYKLRRGEINNIDASDRTQRAQMFRTPLLVMAILVAVLYWGVHARESAIGAGVAWLLLALHGVANRWSKPSMHTSFAVLAASYLVYAWPLGMWFGVLFAVLIGWGRVAYNRHTTQEVLLGACFGAIAGLVFAQLTKPTF